jgi:hypothetical protein
MKFSSFNTLGWRIALSLLAGLLLAWGLSEAAYYLLKDSSDRVPERVELVIPPGTAEGVARGEAPPSIPTNMVFVAGDTLVVKNEDSVSHQLGPVWVPPGTSASLLLDREESTLYACTFEPSRYLGLDVRPSVTLTTRLQAIGFAGPPMVVLIFIYSLVIWPLKPKAADNKLPAANGK